MSDRWWEISVICEPSLEDSVFWRLSTFGCKGTATHTKGKTFLIKGYVPESEINILDLGALSVWLQQDAQLLLQQSPLISWQLLDDTDWNSAWKEHWQPQEIGERFLIVPAWLEPPKDSDKIILRIDPGAAFGTGVHATTQLCLESVEMRLGPYGEPNSIIADIGCGSGILSIGALLLGSPLVYAFDLDPLAINATLHNCEINNIESQRIIVRKGSVEELATLLNDQKLDGIVCNILPDVIVELIPRITTLIKPEGWVSFSGIPTSQMNVVMKPLENQGWNVATVWRRQEWSCINARLLQQ